MYKKNITGAVRIQSFHLMCISSVEFFCFKKRNKRKSSVMEIVKNEVSSAWHESSLRRETKKALLGIQFKTRRCHCHRFHPKPVL